MRPTPPEFPLAALAVSLLLWGCVPVLMPHLYDPTGAVDASIVDGVESARRQAAAAPGDTGAAIHLGEMVVVAWEQGTVSRGALDGPAVAAEAIAALDAAAEGQPDDRWALFATRGKVQAARGDTETAIADLERSLGKRFSHNALDPLVVILEARGEASRAHGHCRAGLDAAADDSARYFVLRACERASGGDTLETRLPWATAEERAFFVAEEQAAAARRAERTAPPTFEPSPDPAPSAQAAPASPAPPAAVSVRIRNECRDPVNVFYGASPQSSGTHSRLGGNSVSSRTFRPGHGMWLTDERRRPYSGVTVSESTREIVVDRSCSGLMAR